MPYLVCGAAVKEVTDKFVPVSAHRNEIATLGFSSLHNFRRRIPKDELRRSFHARTLYTRGRFVEVTPVRAHLFGLGELELIERPRGPAIGDVDEQQFRAEQLRQLLDVRQQRF